MVVPIFAVPANRSSITYGTGGIDGRADIPNRLRRARFCKRTLIQISRNSIHCPTTGKLHFSQLCTVQTACTFYAFIIEVGISYIAMTLNQTQLLLTVGTWLADAGRAVRAWHLSPRALDAHPFYNCRHGFTWIAACVIVIGFFARWTLVTGAIRASPTHRTPFATRVVSIRLLARRTSITFNLLAGRNRLAWAIFAGDSRHTCGSTRKTIGARNSVV
jgi:hypothetical protein